MKTLNIVVILALIAMALSCEKEPSDSNPDPTPKITDSIAPIISFTEPVNSVYKPIGVTIPIKAQVTDNENIKVLNLVVTNSNSTDSVYIEFSPNNQKDFQIDTSFVANAPAGSHTNFNIKVVAKDNENTTKGYKYVHVMN